MTDKRTVLVGLIGSDLKLSKTPALHEREGACHGLDYRYERVDIHERDLPASALPDLLRELEDRGFSGTNITHPFKQTVLPLLDELSEDARMLGAVNTVVFRNDKRVGHNTDWYGFYESFRRGLPDARRERVLLLGAGGAGVAVAHAALKLGVTRLDIFDRDPARAAQLAEDLNRRFDGKHALPTEDLAKSMAASDGLIHATPTGMTSHPGIPIEETLLESRHWVADIVYMPIVTELLAAASRRGCRILPGGGMTVFQAVGAFRLFTGLEPDAERMQGHFAELFDVRG